jgi:hypothetical protein
MCGQVRERDLPAVALRYPRAGRQELGYRLIEPDFSMLDHIGQQQCREYLGYRADLKHAVAGQRTAIALLGVAVGHDPPPLRVDDPDDNADTLLLDIDSVRQNPADLRV